MSLECSQSTSQQIQIIHSFMTLGWSPGLNFFLCEIAVLFIAKVSPAWTV